LGRFGLLDVLDAQRTLMAVGGQYVRALSEYHQAVVRVERLIGAPLPTQAAAVPNAKD
jgi:cobalt-zinc-cadmium efflux system outer membrane protein